MSVPPSPLELNLLIGSGDEAWALLSEVSGRTVAEGSMQDLPGLRTRWRQTRAAWSEEPNAVTEIGHLLASTLPFAIVEALQEAIGRTIAEKRPLFIRLAGDGGFELPWEWLWLRKETPFDAAEGPLALIPQIRISRESGTNTALQDQDLRILVVTADPGSGRFQRLPWLAAEARSIVAAFDASRRRGIELRTIFDAMPSTLERALADFKPHLLHFAGHGEARPSGGVLALNGPRSGTERTVKGSELALWLAAAETQFVFLSACDTAGAPGAVAELLVDGGIPSVVAMQTPVSDASQPHFARVFYGAVLSGASIDEAVAEARQASPGAWAAPTLYASGHPLTLVESKAALGRSPNNLPRFDSAFLGRERETEEVIKLCQTSRLVTLVGPGGIGKTRLAVEAAALSMDTFPGGVWRIECESCVNGEDVLFAIARTLEIEGDDRTAQTRVDAFLQDRKILLILDCLEGLVAARGASIVESLLAGSSVSLVATSRFKLGLPSETVFEVLPIDPQGRSARDLILKTAGREGDTLSDREEKALANVCAALEGIPLALIVAAGRLRFLKIAELETLLGESPLSTLGGTSSGLGAAIRRSLELIPDEDINLLRDLSVFAGAFSGADVIEVFPEEKFEMLEGLGRLADRSLLQPEGDQGSRRYRILDSLREYLASHESASSENPRTSQARDRHLSLYAERAKSSAELMGLGKWSEGTRLLWDSLPNLRAALDFGMAHAKFDRVEALCRSLARTLMEAAMWREYELFSAAGQKAAIMSNRPALRSFLLSLDGAVCAYKGDHEGAEALWIQRLDLCREMDNHLGASDVLLDLAEQACATGKLDQAEAWLTQAAEEVKLAGRNDFIAQLAIIRCVYLEARGDLTAAAQAADETVRHVETFESFDSRTSVYMLLAAYWQRTGAFSQIRRSMAPILKATFQGERRQMTGKILNQMAAAFEAEGSLEAAARCRSGAVAIFRELGSRRLPEAVKNLEAFRAAHPETAALHETTLSWRDQVQLVLDHIEALTIEESTGHF